MHSLGGSSSNGDNFTAETEDTFSNSNDGTAYQCLFAFQLSLIFLLICLELSLGGSPVSQNINCDEDGDTLSDKDSVPTGKDF